MPLESLITVHKHPENGVQSSLFESISRMIHLLGVFVFLKGRYGQIYLFWGTCFAPKTEYSCRNHKKCPKAPQKQDIMIICWKFIKMIYLPDGLLMGLLYMVQNVCIGSFLEPNHINSPKNCSNGPKAAGNKARCHNISDDSIHTYQILLW